MKKKNVLPLCPLLCHRSQSNVSRMVWPRLLVITQTLSLFTLGSLTQTSHSMDHWITPQVALGRGRRSDIQDSLSSEVIFLSERRHGSLEGSGQAVDSSTLQTHVNRKVIPKEPRPAGNQFSVHIFSRSLFSYLSQ